MLWGLDHISAQVKPGFGHTYRPEPLEAQGPPPPPEQWVPTIDEFLTKARVAVEQAERELAENGERR